MAGTNRAFIKQRVEQADIAKKVNPLDLSSDQDLTIGLMNLIAIEDATDTDSELHRMIADMRTQLMSRIVLADTGLFDISVQLLGQAIRLMTAGFRTSGDDSYVLYDTAYGVYSAFWGLNMGLIGIEDAKKILNDAIIC
jgi:hypothetical protein